MKELRVERVVFPEDTIKPRKNASSAGQKPNTVVQGQERNQGFQQAGRNAWGPTRGCGPRNFGGQGPRRGQGQGHMRGKGFVSQPNKRKTSQLMVNLLADILQ